LQEDKKPNVMMINPMKPDENTDAIAAEGMPMPSNQNGITFMIKGKMIPLRTVLIAILGIMLIVFTCVICFHPNFQVGSVEIEGTKIMDAQTILTEMDIHSGDHLFARLSGGTIPFLTTHYGDLEEQIKRDNPYIKDIDITIEFPSRVHVKVTERHKIAYIAVPDGYAVIDQDGVVVEYNQGSVPLGIPEIQGLPITAVVLGKTIELENQEGYEVCLTILGAMLGADATESDVEETFEFLAYVKSVRYCGYANSFIVMTLPGQLDTITVKIGSLKNISDDMLWLRYAISHGSFDDTTGRFLDMSGNSPVFK